MKAVFKTRDQWFFIKQLPDEPKPEDFQIDKGRKFQVIPPDQIDWNEFDLAKKNYQFEVNHCKRHAVRITNPWLVEACFPGQGTGTGEIFIVETIEANLYVTKISRVEPNKTPERTKQKGGKMKR